MHPVFWYCFGGTGNIPFRPKQNNLIHERISRWPSVIESKLVRLASMCNTSAEFLTVDFTYTFKTGTKRQERIIVQWVDLQPYVFVVVDLWNSELIQTSFQRQLDVLRRVKLCKIRFDLNIYSQIALINYLSDLVNFFLVTIVYLHICWIQAISYNKQNWAA